MIISVNIILATGIFKDPFSFCTIVQLPHVVNLENQFVRLRIAGTSVLCTLELSMPEHSEAQQKMRTLDVGRRLYDSLLQPFRGVVIMNLVADDKQGLLVECSTKVPHPSLHSDNILAYSHVMHVSCFKGDHQSHHLHLHKAPAFQGSHRFSVRLSFTSCDCSNCDIK